MTLLSGLNFELPLTNPVIIFSLVLFIILFAPIIFNKIKVPHIVGLILAGVIIGPYGFNLLNRDSSIVLFGTVGLLYIMFLAGLEMDITEFKKNKAKILIFGLITFILPFGAGTLAGYYLLGYSWISSVLVGAMLSTHTLIAYPIASRFGVARNRAVTLTIGGTMITDVIALFILAGAAGMAQGNVDSSFWIQLGISTLLFVATVFFVLPFIIRWFFKKFDDSVSQYIFVLAIIFLSSFLAEAAGMEAVIGAFFAGLVLNSFIPHSSPLMNRIDFVGNALFIPFFLIGVGMLVDVKVLFQGWGPLKVAGVIVAVAIITKYLAAVLTRKVFKLTSTEGDMIFGLSTSRAAATLAIVLVGYNIITGETIDGKPIRLLNEDVLNGTMLLILISSSISSFIVEKASRKLMQEEEKDTDLPDPEQKILICLSTPENMGELVDFGLLLKPKKSATPVYALHVVSDEDSENGAQSGARRMLDNSVKRASATENTLIPLLRHDANVSNGIIYSTREQGITDLVFGMHQHASDKTILGNTIANVLRRNYETVYVYRHVQPLNTLKQMVLAVTPKAELEPGFSHWFKKVVNLAREGGLSIVMYANAATTAELKHLQSFLKEQPEISYKHFSNWDDFLVFTGVVKQNDLFTIVSSRKSHISYHAGQEKLPYYLANYFSGHSILVIYPRQLEYGLNMEAIQTSDSSLADTINESVQVTGGLFRKIFGRKK